MKFTYNSIYKNLQNLEMNRCQNQDIKQLKNRLNCKLYTFQDQINSPKQADFPHSLDTCSTISCSSFEIEQRDEQIQTIFSGERHDLEQLVDKLESKQKQLENIVREHEIRYFMQKDEISRLKSKLIQYQNENAEQILGKIFASGQKGGSRRFQYETDTLEKLLK